MSNSIEFSTYNIIEINNLWSSFPAFYRKLLDPHYKKLAIEYSTIRNKERKCTDLQAHRAASTVPPHLTAKMKKLNSTFTEVDTQAFLLNSLLTNELTILVNQIRTSVTQFQSRHERIVDIVNSFVHLDTTQVSNDDISEDDFCAINDYRIGSYLTEFQVKQEKDAAIKLAKKAKFDATQSIKNSPTLITVGQLDTLLKSAKTKKKKNPFPNGGPKRPTAPPKRRKKHRKGGKAKTPKRRNGNK